MGDDRVCIHYVLDRLESILALHDPESPEIADMKYVHRDMFEFKEELIYILGANQRARHNDGT